MSFTTYRSSLAQFCTFIWFRLCFLKNLLLTLGNVRNKWWANIWISWYRNKLSNFSTTLYRYKILTVHFGLGLWNISKQIDSLNCNGKYEVKSCLLLFTINVIRLCDIQKQFGVYRWSQSMLIPFVPLKLY